MSAIAARAVVATARARTRIRPRRVGAVLALVAAFVFCVSISIGDFSISLVDVVRGLVGEGDQATVIVVQDLRLPRAVSAVLVGAAFGLAGAIFQAVTRNALASPDLLGVMPAASTVAVLLITAANASYGLRYAGALAGALAGGALIYVLAYRDGLSPYRFVLVGICLGLMFGSATFLVIAKSELYSASQATVWLTGSLSSAGWETAIPTALTVGVLAPVAVALSARMRVLQLGDDIGEALGARVERSRLALLVVAVALAGAATAAAGPVAFVAFMSGPIARRLTDAPMTLVPAALVGALLVLGADLAGRRLFAPTEIPVGVMTGIAGAPYLLWLLARANRIGRGG